MCLNTKEEVSPRKGQFLKIMNHEIIEKMKEETIVKITKSQRLQWYTPVHLHFEENQTK